MQKRLRFLTDENISLIKERAQYLLKKFGVTVHNKEVLALLAEHGASVDLVEERVYMNEMVVEQALKTVPSEFSLFDRSGNRSFTVGDSQSHFVPGSAAIDVYDCVLNKHRKPLTSDYIKYIGVAEQLPSLSAQSTAFIPSDVVNEISDSYRLFLSLLYGNKPVVTGAFRADSFSVMSDLQLIIRGTGEELRLKPMTIFSCCPSSPLKWSMDTSQNILDCSRASIPIELVAMPLCGFLAPVTLFDTLIQHTAENLSGVVISQCANPGAPLLYGGSPAIFDMRFQTTPMGAIETMMIICAYNEIGKSYKIPTQAYISLSDAKQLDMQAGIETGIGAILAVLSGIDSISGPGMIDFESSFSIEKLIVDNEICRMTDRLKRGISRSENDDFPSIFLELISENHVLTAEHTQTHLRSEHLMPGVVINRKNRDKWDSDGQPTLINTACKLAKELNSEFVGIPHNSEIQNELFKRMEAESEKYGLTKLPVDQKGLR